MEVLLADLVLRGSLVKVNDTFQSQRLIQTFLAECLTGMPCILHASTLRGSGSSPTCIKLISRNVGIHQIHKIIHVRRFRAYVVTASSSRVNGTEAILQPPGLDSMNENGLCHRRAADVAEANEEDVEGGSGH